MKKISRALLIALGLVGAVELGEGCTPPSKGPTEELVELLVKSGTSQETRKYEECNPYSMFNNCNHPPLIKWGYRSYSLQGYHGTTEITATFTDNMQESQRLLYSNFDYDGICNEGRHEITTLTITAPPEGDSELEKQLGVPSLYYLRLNDVDCDGYRTLGILRRKLNIGTPDNLHIEYNTPCPESGFCSKSVSVEEWGYYDWLYAPKDEKDRASIERANQLREKAIHFALSYLMKSN